MKVTLSTQCNWGGVFAPQPSGEGDRLGRAGPYIVPSPPLCPPMSSLCPSSNFLRDSCDAPGLLQQFPHSLRWPNWTQLDLRIVFWLTLVSSSFLLQKTAAPMPGWEDFEKGTMLRKLAWVTSQPSRIRAVGGWRLSGWDVVLQLSWWWVQQVRSQVAPFSYLLLSHPSNQVLQCSANITSCSNIFVWYEV